MKIVFFAPDIAEASQIKTAMALLATGAELSSLSFRRNNMNRHFSPDWYNVALGEQTNGGLLRRLFQAVGAFGALVRHRHLIRQADVLVARNFDMACLALLARTLARGNARLVYQCLDVHGIFTGQTLIAPLARWCERRLLARTDRLVISSPGFLRNYFGPYQSFDGDHLMVENKVFWGSQPPRRPEKPSRGRGPWRIGWVGTLRCPHSFDILTETARRLGDRVEIHLFGVVHRNMLPDFDHQVAAHGNICFHGAYPYPAGLVHVYEDLDLVWAQDLWQAGSNSDWLLPNRLYEAGFFGCPSIAVAGTETAGRVSADGLGLVLGDASAGSLVDALSRLTPQRLTELQGGLLRRPDRDFTLDIGTYARMISFEQEGASIVSKLA